MTYHSLLTPDIPQTYYTTGVIDVYAVQLTVFGQYSKASNEVFRFMYCLFLPYFGLTFFTSFFTLFEFLGLIAYIVSRCERIYDL